MRELVLKNLRSNDKRRKEIFLSESCERKGCLQKLEKRSVYFVKDVMQITDNFDLELYLDQKRNEGMLHPKQTEVIKTHNSKEAKDKFTYKVWGDLYAVLDNKVYLVGLTQYLKLEFIGQNKK